MGNCHKALELLLEKENLSQFNKHLQNCDSCIDSVTDILVKLSSPEIVKTITISHITTIDEIKHYKEDHLLLYLANPYGFNEPGRILLYLVLTPRLESIDKIKVIDPFIISKQFAPDRDIQRTIAKEIQLLREFNYIAVENNQQEMDLSDFSVGIGDGAGLDSDSGIASEIGRYDKPFYVLRTDFRPGENLGSEGLNVEPWGVVMKDKEKFGIGGVYHRLHDLEKAIKEDLPRLWELKNAKTI